MTLPLLFFMSVIFNFVKQFSFDQRRTGFQVGKGGGGGYKNSIIKSNVIMRIFIKLKAKQYYVLLQAYAKNP